MEGAEEIWAAKSDDELVEASSELFDFTEEGERIIRAELRRRGLPEPDPSIGRCPRCARSIASNHPDERCRECQEPFPQEILRKLGADTPDPALVAVLRTEDPGLVPLAKSILEEEGIEHLVRGEGPQDPFGGSLGRFAGSPVEFWVGEEDAERARVLLDGLDASQAQPGADPASDRGRSDFDNTTTSRQLLRHFLAAIAYRTQKALRGAPDGFGEFRASRNVRTPIELIRHMTGVIGYARTFLRGGAFGPPDLDTFDAEIGRFHAVLAGLHDDFGDETLTATITDEQFLQGPLADAMTHAGQLAMLRRLGGVPVASENFIFADVRAGNVGREQPQPRAPDRWWRAEDLPPPSGPDHPALRRHD
jgi:hypothetical protein